MSIASIANMVDAIWARAKVSTMHWPSVVVLIVVILGRAAAVSARRLGSTRSTSAGRVPPVGQQLTNATVQLRGQSGEHVLEVGPRFVSIELGRLQQAHRYRSAFARQLTKRRVARAPEIWVDSTGRRNSTDQLRQVAVNISDRGQR